MTILENFTKKVTETAREAAKKSGDIVEVTKLNINIGNVENKIEKTYTELGKAVFEFFSRGQNVTEDLIKVHFDKIKAYEDSITEMKQKILELKNVKACPTCQTVLDADMEFCFKCGARQEFPQPQDEAEDEKVDEEVGQEETPSDDTSDTKDA